MPLSPAILPQNIIVDTALGNPTLALTYTGAGVATFAITSISYTVDGVSAVAIPDLTFTYSPALQPLANPPVYTELSFAASATVTIGGKYSLSIFDQNVITSIPRGGTDKETGTVATANSFTGLAANNRQVYKLSPDTRTISVVYTVSYVLRVTVPGTIVPPATVATGGSVTNTPQTDTITQTVINNYDALSAALLLVISSLPPQTITFAEIASTIYSATPILLSASASSGLAVTFSVVSGPATVSGSTLTLTGVGIVTVRASQAGDSNYNVAASVNRTFTVNVAYKIFSGSTTTNSTVCGNNGAEVRYSYTSVNAGSGIAIFYSKTPYSDSTTCTLNIAIQITACLSSDAIIGALLNESDPVSGTTPRITPTLQSADCSGALPLLLTTVNNTIDNLIIGL